MATIPASQLSKEVASGKFQPIYYFFGTEDYRITEAVKYVAHQFLPERQIQTNLKRLNCRTTKLPDLIAELSVIPMLGERQVFALADIQGYKPKDLERVFKMIDPADPNRLVIFHTPSARTPKKTAAFFKKMTALATAVEFRRLTPQQVAGQIRTRLARAELEIENDALEMLTGLIAGNRGALESELQKLLHYVEPGEKVTLDAVERLASGYQVYSVFELANYVVSGDRAQALKAISRFLRDGNSPTGLLFFLGQHFVSLFLLKEGKRIEPHRRWLEPRLRPQAGKYSREQLRQMIVSVAEADAGLRRTGAKAEIILDKLIVEMMAT